MPSERGSPDATFEYQCLHCGRVFEVFTQRREPTTMPECPGCGETDVERALSLFSGRISQGGGCATSSLGFG
ncbi:MAG: zinc ribbon domain-containing protein [candidate division NC10 bacterium]|nr:zinc ribbon domain-containing protein [candidate division NC10 bacterium]MBI2114539.1 zinc ribbon domain-containing protein [candidate division NC10 bacterium]MBI2162638.1 zinc ribbon domain-containing protein [candidate division NC10 bacterium]MBI2458790.1 zinc ribbon domain-containing protein [candidate division NC10 bacterium]